ncbi:SHOCT domain-containing protein [Streptomyces sp. NPDC006733]|uniref:SHOCT domain-containing protein n=1 Tax=Streptomyces sp. NPDC006733 TaxID=3155460 RepID=UPI0033FE4333
MGLLRGVARTAVVAGTATAVSNRVSRRQAGRWAQQGRPQVHDEPVDAAPAAAPAAAPSGGMDATIAQLRELGELRSQGVLTDAEFETQKARILNT